MSYCFAKPPSVSTSAKPGAAKQGTDHPILERPQFHQGATRALNEIVIHLTQAGAHGTQQRLRMLR